MERCKEGTEVQYRAYWFRFIVIAVCHLPFQESTYRFVLSLQTARTTFLDLKHLTDPVQLTFSRLYE